MSTIRKLNPRNIIPEGWLADQLEIQKNGLSGNLDKIWRDVRDSAWIGGTAESWERMPYFLDGFIPLGFLTGDEDIKARAKKYVYAIVDKQQPDGWICPCPTESSRTYDVWALFLIGKVLSVWLEYNDDKKVYAALYKAMKCLYEKMVSITPLSNMEMDILERLFREYMTIGGMPAVVNMYVSNGNFSGTLKIQRQLLLDYEEDITKYAQGLDKGKIKNVYDHISVFLGQDNKKFQISKIAHGARNREYVGTIEWLRDAGIINVCYCLAQVSLPLKGNYDPKSYKLYYKDTGLLVASLDEESQENIRVNKNYGTYKGAIYENIVGDILVKQGYNLYFYRNEKSTLEMDFFIRDAQSLIPVEVKATDNATKSLAKLTAQDGKYPDIRYGIKLCNKNIGFNGKFYTFPYFLTFLLKRFVRRER